MKKALVIFVFVMLATALLHETPFAQTGGREIRLVTREVTLVRRHPDIIWDNLVVSPDSKRVAYWAKRGYKQLIVVDGEEEKEY